MTLTLAGRGRHPGGRDVEQKFILPKTGTGICTRKQGLAQYPCSVPKILGRGDGNRNKAKLAFQGHVSERTES